MSAQFCTVLTADKVLTHAWFLYVTGCFIDLVGGKESLLIYKNVTGESVTRCLISILINYTILKNKRI